MHFAGRLRRPAHRRPRLYEVIAPADSHGMVRIIDDSGEDYFYPQSLFETVQIREQTALLLHELLAAYKPWPIPEIFNKVLR